MRMKFSNGDQEFSYTEGVAQSVINSETAEINNTWKQSVETSISAGFGFSIGGIGGGVETSTTVSGEFSTELGRAVSTTIEKTTSEEIKHTTTFDRPGQIWQFVYTIQ